MFPHLHRHTVHRPFGSGVAMSVHEPNRAPGAMVAVNGRLPAGAVRGNCGQPASRQGSAGDGGLASGAPVGYLWPCCC
jgi:hypothetical protein